MAVNCDIQKQVVVKDGNGKKAVILDEKFIKCNKPRTTILLTSKGRLGFCGDHLEVYQAKGKSEKESWLRWRHGMVVSGPPEVEVPKDT